MMTNITCAAIAGLLVAASLVNAAVPGDSQTLYDTSKVWTVHLKFTPEQWSAMEPKRVQRPGAGGPFGRPNPARNPARIGELLSPLVMSQGDGNRDGVVTPAEFVELGKAWFKAWDKANAGKLTEANIRAGIDALPNPTGAGGMTLTGPEGKRNGIASVFGVEYEYAHADLEFEGQLFNDVAVRCKGNGTFLELGNNPKRSFKINLDKYQKGQRLAGVAMLNLQNNITDPSWMNEVLAYRLFRDAQVPAPRTAYAKVLVTVAGQFDRKPFGLYSISENIDEQFVTTQMKAKPGAIFKPVTPMLFADMGADWAAYNQMYDPKTKLTDEQKKAVTDLCRLVSRGDDAEFAERIGAVIDLQEFARLLAVMVYLSDIDGILGPGQNMYLYWSPETRKFRFIPWDQDHSWGQFIRATQQQRNQLSILRPWQGNNPFLERLLKVESFKKDYLKAMEQFCTTIFAPDRIAKQVNELATVLRPAVSEESTPSLERFDLAVAGKMIPPVRRGLFGGGPETQPIKPFAVIRTQSILDQLSGKSEGLRQGNFGMGRNELGAIASGPLYKFLRGDASELSETQMMQGFEKLFATMDAEKSGKLGYAQVRAGLEKAMTR